MVEGRTWIRKYPKEPWISEARSAGGELYTALVEGKGGYYCWEIRRGLSTKPLVQGCGFRSDDQAMNAADRQMDNLLKRE